MLKLTPGQLFSKIQQKKPRNANKFRNIKRVKHMIKVKASWWVAFMDIQNISEHSPFMCKPTQEIHDKQVKENGQR